MNAARLLFDLRTEVCLGSKIHQSGHTSGGAEGGTVQPGSRVAILGDNQDIQAVGVVGELVVVSPAAVEGGTSPGAVPIAASATEGGAGAVLTGGAGEKKWNVQIEEMAGQDTQVTPPSPQVVLESKLKVVAADFSLASQVRDTVHSVRGHSCPKHEIMSPCEEHQVILDFM